MSVKDILTFLQQLLYAMKIYVVSFGAKAVSTADTTVVCTRMQGAHELQW